MEVEKEWWLNPMANDIHETLKLKETKMPLYFSRSPQMHLRRYVVDWLAVICDKFKLCTTARHLSVYLLDYFMDKFDIEEPQLYLVAIGCILVAAKYEEQEINIPKSTDLNVYVNPKGYTAWEYQQMELTLLDCFKWNIGLPTPAHFVDYYITLSVADDQSNPETCKSPVHSAKTKLYIMKYATYFLEISLQDQVYKEYSPSLIASAAVAASRTCLHIKPHWSHFMSKVTMFALNQITPVINIMLKTHDMDEAAAKDDVHVVPMDTSTTTVTSTLKLIPHDPYQTPCSTPTLNETTFFMGRLS
ncbi:unnamed protein product [Owenia fusiformis]|uniref:Uncharacterized protein n=1 Tax=Owenia fusiformis TaxID=6347 RepID=A0A8J1T7T6_OWEFU|nr:unnamed protein product [Owenia fusiformis]